MRPLYSTILLLLSLTTFSQIKFEIRKADKSNTKFDSILIVGAGSKITKVFIENVSDYMIKEFSKNGCVASYFYTENNLDNFKLSSDSINKDHYKAVLYLMPRNTANVESIISLKENTISTSAGSLPTARLSKKIYYSQTFSFQLFTTFENLKQIWSASVNVNVKPGKTKPVKSLAKKVLKSFRDKGYLN